jgi:hypothetical protein
MSQSESFLSRWSRRKTQSSEPATISPAEPASSAAAEKPDRKETRPPALSEANASAAVDFDPASLPTIESISAGADIRPFLQSGVPAELTRAALRRAWATDPAIRDFIEIAENQWDFNDPTAMPGFGPLTAADKAAILAAQTLAGGRGRLAKITDVSISATPASSEAGGAKVGQPVDLATRGPPAKGAAGTEAAGLATEQDEEAVLAERDSAPDARGNRRSHGRALPK